jgi:hypothetical protein
MFSILLIGILGAIIGILVGMFWYADSTPMGKWHMEALGFAALAPEERARLKAEAMRGMWKIWSAQTILSLITALFIGAVTFYTVQGGAPANSVFAYVVGIWLAFTVPMAGQQMLWGNAKGALAWKCFCSNALSNLITYVLVAVVAVLII